MARTAKMRLIELMVMTDDISHVIEYLGKNANFEFRSDTALSSAEKMNPVKEVFDKLQFVRSCLHIPEPEMLEQGVSLPTDDDYAEAEALSAAVTDIDERMQLLESAYKRAKDAETEAAAFANMKVPYSDLSHVTFLTLRIGKIDPAVLNQLQFTLGDRAIITSLGGDNSRILAASSRKGRFALDAELKKFGFVNTEISQDFKGLPSDVLESLEKKVAESADELKKITEEQQNFAESNMENIKRLLSSFSLGMQVQVVKNRLEATQLVYRISGWFPATDATTMMKELDDLTEGRIAIRLYSPSEMPSVRDGTERVPVKLTHGKLIGSFERLIFNYGAPVYGTIDPTPLVAFFFTLLFGIMFGDVGQGLVFVVLGILLCANAIPKLAKWSKFGLILICIGFSSMIMGVLTGEFFGNGEILIPFSRFLSGLFGEPHDHILHLLPSSDSIGKVFVFFGFTLAIGVLINSVGLILNIINQFSLGNPQKALLGKNGLSGALFFWYFIAILVRVFAFKVPFHWLDWVILGITVCGVIADEMVERAIEKKPQFENGVFSWLIEAVVGVLELLISYFSNSTSFLRVGAFALAHVVLGFVIFTMTDMIGGIASPGGLLVTIVGNVVVIGLEGMIVAIQVIRLQYYEFFSKFFTETGKEFVPFRFKYSD